MFGFGRAGSPSRPVYGLQPHSPRAARRSAPIQQPSSHIRLAKHTLASPWALVLLRFGVFAENLAAPLNRSAFDYQDPYAPLKEV